MIQDQVRKIRKIRTRITPNTDTFYELQVDRNFIFLLKNAPLNPNSSVGKYSINIAVAFILKNLNQMSFRVSLFCIIQTFKRNSRKKKLCCTPSGILNNRSTSDMTKASDILQAIIWTGTTWRDRSATKDFSGKGSFLSIRAF